MPAAAPLLNSAPDLKQSFVDRLNQHAGILRKVAFSYSNTPADRHDLEQEIMLQLWKAYPRYSPERPFSTWMYQIALNVGISFLRRNTRPIRQDHSIARNGKGISRPGGSDSRNGRTRRPPATSDRVA